MVFHSYVKLPDGIYYIVVTRQALENWGYGNHLEVGPKVAQPSPPGRSQPAIRQGKSKKARIRECPKNECGVEQERPGFFNLHFFVRVEINVCIDVPLPSQIAGEYVPFGLSVWIKPR